jgi:hypothetical protein
LSKNNTVNNSKSSKISKKTSQKVNRQLDTEKIYITLPKKYVRVLEIIAGDPRDKSKAVEKMIDDYYQYKEKVMKDEGKWYRILAAIKGEPLEEDVAEKIAFLDIYIENHDSKDLKDLWLLSRNNEEKINKIYDKVKAKLADIENNLDNII